MSNAEKEETLFLGGKVSDSHPEYKHLAQLASSGFAWWILDKATSEDWKKKPAQEKVKEIIYTSGQIEFINSTDVLTKLSAILGDTRRKISLKDLHDELTTRINESIEP